MKRIDFFMAVVLIVGFGSGCTLIVDRDCSRNPDFCPFGYDCKNGRCSPIDIDAPAGWVRITAGSFLRGSPEEEVGRFDESGGEPAFWERRHKVTLTRDFYLQAKEVTVAEYREFMGALPDEFRYTDCGDHCPISKVSWNEAALYCNKLSRSKGLEQCYNCEKWPACDLINENPYECEGFRLPTDAEWEYAARAGTTAATYAGNIIDDCDDCCPEEAALQDIAWYCHNAEAEYDTAWDCSSWEGSLSDWCGPQPVGTKAPNDWNLYDMLGNVGEWVNDRFGEFEGLELEDPAGPTAEESSTGRTIRGGSYYSSPRFVRCARRYSQPPDASIQHVGFRTARTVSH